MHDVNEIGLKDETTDADFPVLRNDTTVLACHSVSISPDLQVSLNMPKRVDVVRKPKLQRAWFVIPS